MVSHALLAREDDSQNPEYQTYCIQHAQIGRADDAGPQGKGYQEEIAFTVDSREAADAVAFGWNKSSSQTMRIGQTTDGLQASPMSNPAVLGGCQVRRLTPVECEILMGWTPDHTRYAGSKEMADGPRYKMIGNGVVKPVARWIAERIKQICP